MAHQSSRRYSCFSCSVPLFPRQKGKTFPSRAAARVTLSLSHTHLYRPKVKAILLPRGIAACFTCVNLFQLSLGGAAAFNISDSYLCDVNKMYLASATSNLRRRNYCITCAALSVGWCALRHMSAFNSTHPRISLHTHFVHLKYTL
jgi:hypothetical protein